MQFSEIKKLQWKKNATQTLLCILLVYRIILLLNNIIAKKCAGTPMLSQHSHKPHKNTSLLVATVLKSCSGITL